MRGACLALALIATSAHAQGAGVSQAQVNQSAANGEAQLKENKGSNATPSAGATIMVGSPAQSENCSLPIGGGLANLALGATFIWSHTDQGCEARRDAYALGFFVGRAAAIQRLCQRAGNWKAMKAAGTPCVGETATTGQKP